MQAILALEDGRIFRGEGYGAKAESYGEVVFNTSLTGYQEISPILLIPGRSLFSPIHKSATMGQQCR